jgi:peptidoglycan/LPS O-acetylase OafA/YrhL
LGVIAMAVQLLVYERAASSWVSLSIVGYFQYFAVGLILADLYTADWREQPLRTHVWDLIWMAGWIALVFLLDAPRATIPLFAPIVLLLYVAALRGKVVNRLLRNRVVSTIGGMCYTIYLFHYLIIATVGGGTRHLVFNSYALTICVQAAVLCGPLLFLSAIYFLVIERPCMNPRWPIQLWNRVKRGSPRTLESRGA